MKTQKLERSSWFNTMAILLVAFLISLVPATTFASGGSGSGGVKVDSIKVSKCYCNAGTTGGEMLIKASSSNTAAHLYAYRPDGSYIGEVQNGGGSRYGGTVMPWQPYDPGTVVILSSFGGGISAPTTPFQL
jgi:hypothetical protein